MMLLARAIITDPEIGSGGPSEEQIQAAGLEAVVVVRQLPASFRGWLHGSGNGLIKLVVERHSAVQIGATAVGSRGGDMLGLLAFAVHARIPLRSCAV